MTNISLEAQKLKPEGMTSFLKIKSILEIILKVQFYNDRRDSRVGYFSKRFSIRWQKKKYGHSHAYLYYCLGYFE